MSSLQRRNVPRRSAAELERLRAEKNWNALWEQALPLVGFCIDKLVRNGKLKREYATDDLIQQGNLFAGKYVRSWNPKLGKFSTWLVANLYRQLLQEISANAKGMVGGRDAQGTTASFDEGIQVNAGPERPQDSELLRVQLHAAISSLPALNGLVITALYGIGREPLTVRQVAAEFGMSRSTVSRLSQSILAQLGTKMNSSA